MEEILERFPEYAVAHAIQAYNVNLINQVWCKAIHVKALNTRIANRVQIPALLEEIKNLLQQLNKEYLHPHVEMEITNALNQLPKAYRIQYAA